MAIAKSADAFRTISEASEELDLPQHVLRHWEEVFGQIRPMRRAGGRRYYRPVDLDVLRGVRVLLYNERYTTKGVQKIFRENGVKYVADLGRQAGSGQPFDLRPLVNEDLDDRERGASEGFPIDQPLTPEIRDCLLGLIKRLESAREALESASRTLETLDERLKG